MPYQPLPMILPTLVPVFRGRHEEVPASILPPVFCPPLACVSVAPFDHIDSVRDRLLDDVIRILHTEDWMAGDIAPWRDLYRKAVDALYPGSPADLAEVHAPAPPLDAVVWQLADDQEAYPDQAGWWIVVDGSHEEELSPAYPTQDEAQREADRLNSEDPMQGAWYRHWFRITNCCDGDYIAW